MSTEPDAKAQAILDSTTELLDKKLQERLEEKWPEYRETESAAVRREILLGYQRRMATRWARIWLPGDGDKELRAVEDLVFGYIDRVYGDDGSNADADTETAHRIVTQGLVYVGNTLAKVLRQAQGGNEASRLAAIEWVGEKLEAGVEPAEILEEAARYEGPSTPEEADPGTATGA